MLPLPYGAEFPAAYAFRGILAGSFLLMTLLRAKYIEQKLIIPIFFYVLILLWMYFHPSAFVNTTETSMMISRWGGYLAFFLGCYLYASLDRKSGCYILVSIVLSSFAYALYGLMTQPSDVVLGLVRVNHLDSVTSVFLTRNSFAAYMSLGIMATFILFIRMVQFATWQRICLCGIIYVQFTALAETGSRTIVFLVILTLLFLMIVFPEISKAVMDRKFRVWGLLVMLSFIMANLDSQSVKRIPFLIEQAPIRLQAYKIAIQHISDSLFLGYGPATFRHVFARLKCDDFDGHFIQLHNDYLEFIYQFGLPAALILWFSLGKVIQQIWQNGDRLQCRTELVLVTLIWSLILILNALFDFALQTPAIAYLWAGMLGTSCAKPPEEGDTCSTKGHSPTE